MHLILQRMQSDTMFQLPAIWPCGQSLPQCDKMHSSHDCPTKDKKGDHWYAVCNARGHEAWSYKCPRRIEQKEKARAALAKRPILFVEAGEEGTTGPREVRAEEDDRGRKRGRSCSTIKRSPDGRGAEGPTEASKERWIEIQQRMARESSTTLPRPVGRPSNKKRFEKFNFASGSHSEETL